MKYSIMKVQRFFVADLGSIAVKFAILLALVTVVGITAYASFETSVNPSF